MSEHEITEAAIELLTACKAVTIDYEMAIGQLEHIDEADESLELLQNLREKMDLYETVIIGVDLAKKDSEVTVIRCKCPTCKTFQDLVSPDYLCKECGKEAQINIILGI